MLNNIIHPEVIKDIKKIIARIKKSNPEAMVIIEAPLLFEANMQDMMDKIIVVSAKRNIQLERAKRRTHLPMVQIRKRINSQMPLSKKKRLADIIIDNNGSLEETRKQVEKFWEKVSETTTY